MIHVPGIIRSGLSALVGLFRSSRSREDVASAEIDGLKAEISRLRANSAAREKAEAASFAKSRFIATVSHEIRTPLNGIMGLAQLLAMTPLMAEQASYVEAMLDCGRSLAQLIDDILDFSKIEAGKLELRHEVFALAPLVEGVGELLAPRAHSKNLEIATLISANAPARIEGDPARLRQVLINLVGNAINFSERGGVAIRVVFEAPGALRFDVEDTGPGVPAEAHEAIFEEFAQADASATRRHGGTGLGLAISRRLVGQMGGSLTIASTSAQGTTFSFSLPVVAQRSERRHDALEGRRALIVAESRFEAPFLADIINSAGGSCEIARGASAGLARLASGEAERFDTLIVDCALGPEATVELAQRAPAAGVGRRFLLFSPLERRAYGEAALRSFDGWLVKPVRAASLIDRLSSAPSEASHTPVPEICPTLLGLRVLLAEDNEINALIAAKHLQRLGAVVTRAEDGLEAIRQASEAIDGRVAPFGVIVTDLFMPKVDGLEAIARIRLEEARAGGRRTPIVALTASAQEDDARAARAAGADAILTKPVEFGALALTIEDLREGRELRA